MKELWILVISLLITAVLCSNPCAPRDYGEETIVCVCNSTYCDDIQQPEDDEHHLQAIFQYTTSKSGKRLEYSRHRLNGHIPRGEEHLPRYKVNRTKTYQEIFGFGCALTDSAGYNFKSLSKETQDNLMRSYFGKEGIEYTFLRIPVATSFDSLRNYSSDDVPGDTSLTYFKLPEEDLEYKVDLIKVANKLNGAPMKLFGSSWFPPMWMMKHVEDGDIWILDPQYWDTWAHYWVKYFDAYADEGLQFWGMTEQNDPYSSIVAHSLFSISWTKEELLEWTVKYLGPALSEKYSHLKVMILDDIRSALEEYADLFYTNKTACSYVSGTAVQWNDDWTVSTDVLDRVHFKYPNKFLMYSESPMNNDTRPGPYIVLGDWVAAEMYISDMIEVFNHHVSGWTDWACVADLDGGPSWFSTSHSESPIIVNVTADEFYKEPAFYALGHFSKFVPPGSIRVHLDIEGDKNSGLNSVAFRKPSGSTVIILYNKNEEDKKIIIDEGSHKGSFVATVEGNSMNTFVYH